MLYLFDIKGGVKATYQYDITLQRPWPASSQEAAQLITPYLDKNNHPSLPEGYYFEHESHSWYGFKQEVILSSDEKKTQAQLVIREHDLWHQFLLIHKGHAGKIFWFFGMLLGVSLAFSLISGVVLAFNIAKFKNNAILSIALGLATLVFIFLLE